MRPKGIARDGLPYPERSKGWGDPMVKILQPARHKRAVILKSGVSFSVEFDEATQDRTKGAVVFTRLDDAGDELFSTEVATTEVAAVLGGNALIAE